MKERKFIADSVKKVLVTEYIRRETETSGFGSMEMKRTPFGTNITLYVNKAVADMSSLYIYAVRFVLCSNLKYPDVMSCSLLIAHLACLRNSVADPVGMPWPQCTYHSPVFPVLTWKELDPKSLHMPRESFALSYADNINKMPNGGKFSER